MCRKRLAIGFWTGHAAAVLFLASMFLPAPESDGPPGCVLALVAFFTCLTLPGTNPGPAAACVLGTLANLFFLPNYVFFLVQAFCPDDYRRRTPILSTTLGFVASASGCLLADVRPSHVSVGCVAWLSASGLLMTAALLRRQPRVITPPQGFEVLTATASGTIIEEDAHGLT